MTLPTSTLALVGAGALIYVGLLLIKPILAFVTSSPDDLTRIRANFEGLLGEAGPGMKVVDIVKTGGVLPTSTRAAQRSYLVTLEKPDGTVEHRRVSIEVALLGQGAMTVETTRRSANP